MRRNKTYRWPNGNFSGLAISMVAVLILDTEILFSLLFTNHFFSLCCVVFGCRCHCSFPKLLQNARTLQQNCSLKDSYIPLRQTSKIGRMGMHSQQLMFTFYKNENQHTLLIIHQSVNKIHKHNIRASNNPLNKGIQCMVLVYCTFSH